MRAPLHYLERTMHIRILTSIAGTSFAWHPGQIVDVPERLARALADGRRAELVRPERPRRAARGDQDAGGRQSDAGANASDAGGA